MTSIELSDVGGVRSSDIDIRVLPPGNDSASPYHLSPSPISSSPPSPKLHASSHERHLHPSSATHSVRSSRAHEGTMLDVPEDSDQLDEDAEIDLPPIKVKEALTYSLLITMAHEIAGTFAFIYSILAVATNKNSAGTTDVAFAIAAAAFVYSHVFNKAHFNTWITVYLYLTDLLGRTFDAELIELYPEQYRGVTKKLPRDSKRAVRFMSFVHVICQLIGSTLAARLVYSFPLADSHNLANIAVAPLFQNSEGTSPNAKAVFVAMFLEFLITYALLYSLDIGDEGNHRPGRSKAVFFSVGPPIVLFLGVRTVGDYTGASFNFARHFGPALITGEWNHGAIAFYAVAQFLAVLLAITVEHYRFRKHISNRRKELKLLAEQKEQIRSIQASRRESRMINSTRRTTKN
jgi:glycerol uptake facilitator-like aquaporin